MLDSTGSALQGFEDISCSLIRNFESKPKAPGHSHRFRDSGTGICLKGMTRISASLMRAPIHMGIALTEGLHNSPKLWGDRTVRPLDDVHDLPSGLKAGGKVSFSVSQDSCIGVVVTVLGNVLWCLRWSIEPRHKSCF